MVQFFIELIVGEIFEEKRKLTKRFLLNFQIVFRTYVFSELFVVDGAYIFYFFYFFFFFVFKKQKKKVEMKTKSLKFAVSVSQSLKWKQQQKKTTKFSGIISSSLLSKPASVSIEAIEAVAINSQLK